jgi:hypothetical protein
MRILACAVALAFGLIGLNGCGGGSSNVTPPSANPISVVQSLGVRGGCSSSTGCNSQSLALPNPVANGDFIAVVLWWSQSNATPTSVTINDSQNNMYTNVAPTNAFAFAYGQTLAYGFYARTVAGGSNFTVTASTNSQGFGFYMAVVEAKNVTTFDQWAAGNNCTNAQGCTVFSTNPFQEMHADALLVSVGALTAPSGCQGSCLSGVTLETGPGFTMISDNLTGGTGSRGLASEYLVTTTPGQYNGTFMASGPADDGQLFFVFY